MAKLSGGDRQKLKSSQFALPGKGEGKSGKGSGSYPINDRTSGKSVESTVRAKVKAKFPDIGIK